MWGGFDTLQCELERTPQGAILWVTLNRPKAFNALSAECLTGLKPRGAPLIAPAAWLAFAHRPPAAAAALDRTCPTTHRSPASLPAPIPAFILSKLHAKTWTAELHRVFAALEYPTSMLQQLPADHPRVVVLRGAGRAFCGGVDIKVGLSRRWMGWQHGASKKTLTTLGLRHCWHALRAFSQLPS